MIDAGTSFTILVGLLGTVLAVHTLQRQLLKNLYGDILEALKKTVAAQLTLAQVSELCRLLQTSAAVSQTTFKVILLVPWQIVLTVLFVLLDSTCPARAGGKEFEDLKGCQFNCDTNCSAAVIKCVSVIIESELHDVLVFVLSLLTYGTIVFAAILVFRLALHPRQAFFAANE